MVDINTKKASRYKKYLLEREAVHGILAEFRVELKNIGEKKLPEGSLNVEFELPAGVETVSASMPEVKLSSLEANKSFVKKGFIRFPAPGLWKATLTVSPSDSEKIEYCFSKIEGTFDKCILPIYVIDRIQVELLRTLDSTYGKKGE
jgi:hypothetical protein